MSGVLIVLAFLVLLMPLSSFLVLVILGKKHVGKGPYLSISAIISSLIFSLIILQAVARSGHVEFSVPWIPLGERVIDFGILLDPLSSIMLVVVTGVSALAQIFSLGYMSGEKRLNWYFACMSLFTTAMLVVVLANNYLELLIGWELVGICSYLLIGFWFERDYVPPAASKAFIVTRLADMPFLLGIILLFLAVGSFDFDVTFAAVDTLAPSFLTASAILLFFGAWGKSAQFPLHIWLPDAMAGPSPVSALIHAATMVAAGVYLVARSFPLFEAAPHALTLVAYVGATTTIFAAIIAMTMVDIKKVVAYSTISQLGYMMTALGVGSMTAGIFHLFTHAYFKALLFLAAGSVIHTLHTQDMREMSGVGKKMKITFITFVIGAAALAGIPPLSGFFSKEEIINHVFSEANTVIFFAALATVFLTAFYISRLIFLTFFGEVKGKMHESPRSMTVPLFILAGLSIVVGFFGSPFSGFSFITFLEPEAHLPQANLFITALSVGSALYGLFLAYLIYQAKSVNLERFKAFKPLHTIAFNKFYIDEFYQQVILKPGRYITEFARTFDIKVIDAFVNGVRSATYSLAEFCRRFDKGVVDRAIVGTGAQAVAISKVATKVDLGVVDRGLDGTGARIAEAAKAVAKADSGVIDKGLDGTSAGLIKAAQKGSYLDAVSIDGFIDGMGLLVVAAGRRLAKIQGGNLQSYVLVIFIVLLLMMLFLLR